MQDLAVALPQEHKPVQQTNVQGAQTQQEQSPAVEQGQVNPAAQYADAAEGLDSVLDDIESVLENNAEDYVNHFVQKGGE